MHNVYTLRNADGLYIALANEGLRSWTPLKIYAYQYTSAARAFAVARTLGLEQFSIDVL